MIVILYPSGSREMAKKVASDLEKAFLGNLAIKVVPASTATTWPETASWDDLLIVMYDTIAFPAKGNEFIKEFIKQHRQAAKILPVAIDPRFRSPPAAAEAIKALPYDRSAKGTKGRLVRRVGAMLGLRVQGRESQVFISYRAFDGSLIANQLHHHLISLGYNVFLDEAKELDGDTRILPGSPVQKEIDDALSKANLMLLIDTPSAPDSKWITHEVDTADSLLLPILPVCFRDKEDPKQGPRFRSLLALQRWVQFASPKPKARSPLTDAQLDHLVVSTEEYLCDIFKRKCRVPFIVEKEFVSRGFAWSILDERLLMFGPSKGTNWRIKTNILSHCSIFDPSYGPALERFWDFIKSASRHNYSLFLYDGELIPEQQLKKIVDDRREESAIILHHQELAALIDSNFTMLR